MPFDNPLAAALGQGQVMPSETGGPQQVVFRIPRILKVRVEEIQNGRTALPGTSVSLKVDGTIKMTDDDGDILVNVTRVDGRKTQDTPSDPDRDVIRPLDVPAPG